MNPLLPFLAAIGASVASLLAISLWDAGLSLAARIVKEKES